MQSENNNSATPQSDSPKQNHTWGRLRSLSLTIDRNADVHIRFANDMPLSVIVHGYNKDEIKKSEKRIMKQCKESAYLLYTKYILSGSEFEVNISYRVRSALHGLMSSYMAWVEDDTMSTDVLLQIFDDSVSELYRLLKHSFHRFNTKLV